MKAGTPSQPVLSTVNSNRIIVGNWSLTCKKEGELQINNSDGQQSTILKEDLPGFIFESNRGTKHSFTAETSLGPEFSAGWTGKRNKKFRSKMEAVKQKVGSTNNFLETSESQLNLATVKINAEFCCTALYQEYAACRRCAVLYGKAALAEIAWGPVDRQ